MSNQLLTTRQLAEVLNIAEATVRAWLVANEITPVITVQVELRRSRGGGREWSPGA